MNCVLRNSEKSLASRLKESSKFSDSHKYQGWRKVRRSQNSTRFKIERKFYDLITSTPGDFELHFKNLSEEPPLLSYQLALSYLLWATSFGLRALGYKLWATSFELPALSYQLWATSFELPAWRYQLWATSFEQRPLSYQLWPTSFKLAALSYQR